MFTKCELKSQFPNKFQVSSSFHNQKQFCFSNNTAEHPDKMQESVANHKVENQQSSHQYSFSYNGTKTVLCFSAIPILKYTPPLARVSLLLR